MGPDQCLQIGDTVDADTLANADLLIEQKHLRLLPVAAANSDGEAALRAQVAELEAKVAAQDRRIAALEESLAPKAEGKPVAKAGSKPNADARA